MFSPEESALFKYIYPETLYLIDTEFEGKELVEELTKDQHKQDISHVIAEKPAAQTTVVQPVFQGANTKKILILIGDDSLNDPALKDLLMKILGAVGLKDDDIALAILEKSLIPQDYFHASKCQKAVLFGITPSFAGFQTDLYSLSGDTIKTIFSDSLATVAADVNIKKKLWQALKLLFGV